MAKIRVLGLDMALNHGAIVELTNGKLSNFWYYTDLAGSANRSKRGSRLDPAIIKQTDKHIRGIRRLAWVYDFVDNVMSNSLPDYVGIEDYALRAEQGAHQMGEMGAMARMAVWIHDVPMRLHDPTTIKMFVVHDGTCQKDAVARACKERWGINFDEFDLPSNGKKPNKQTSEDLYDAYGVAMLTWTEYQLRQGLIDMSDLHEKEIRVFNRTSKTYPINLLSREWIRLEDD